ncbi:hypothetical protein GLAREA_08607 [Glarea lozoyensis ATCC 20868]|uniref:Extracellular membrane protein CFEM domain-containing protein n=1 Tax=Glarea lozoyensis (strain ATCC 20868 / MF5171) TaxID=1116229 RepID=S3CHJ6_GLAL2|nr:uncharacterized protein GLAREA_08607 [Glarea lozoyensis ATCC 20868]EPE24754.1 hypothetical protein GLAREA_08607 [Glarea lozoyensis ATCC 20868]
MHTHNLLIFTPTFALYITAHLLAPRNQIHQLNALPSPSPTPPPTIELKSNLSCLLLGEALAICGSLTPSFATLDATVQAKCLCYSSTVWRPDLFDGAVGGCADFASRSATSAYGALKGIEGFCGGVGDVERVGGMGGMGVDGMVGGSVGGGSVGGMTMSVVVGGNAGCSQVQSIMAACSQLTPGFGGMNDRARAKCLCYPNSGTWAPTIFDNALSTCNAFAKTAEPTLFSSLADMQGFCSSVGNFAVASTTMASLPPVVTEISVLPLPAPISSLDLSVTATNPPTTPSPEIQPSSTSPSDLPTPNHGMQTSSPLPVIVPTGHASRPKPYVSATKWEVIMISAVCAGVVLFLW